MAIDSVFLRNFKCFEKQKFNFKNVTILAGINSVGKSTVIQSLLMILQSEDESDLEFNGYLTRQGEYDDILKQDADDEGIQVEVNIENLHFCWGYPEGYESGNIVTMPPLLPFNKGNVDKVDSLKKLKSSFQYLSAERWGPRGNVPILRNHRKNWLGKFGEHTIPFLFYLDNYKSSAEEDVLVEGSKRLLGTQENNSMFSVVRSWMSEVAPGTTLFTRASREASAGWSLWDDKYKAINVGFGLSYVLGIVTALVCAKKGDVILLENPEAHIHPCGQSLLGQLIARAGQDGVQVIVETHSEHLINGVRVAVRRKDLSHDNMKVFFFDKELNQTTANVTEIESNESAGLSAWPKGFFDQVTIDMGIIIKG